MQIQIRQKMISIGDKYQVYINDVQTHRASRKVFSLNPFVSLYAMDSDRPRYSFEKYLRWFKTEVELVRWDNQIFHFRAPSFWKVYYQCETGAGLYEVHGHRGRKFSVFLNGIQIAWWDKNAMSWGEADQYAIIANNDIDTELVISFCLIVDMLKNNDNDSMINIDLGNLWEDRRFDTSWQPK